MTHPDTPAHLHHAIHHAIHTALTDAGIHGADIDIDGGRITFTVGTVTAADVDYLAEHLTRHGITITGRRLGSSLNSEGRRTLTSITITT
jgi:hypothetical protein